MPGRRKNTLDIRELLRHLRQGRSNRGVAQAMGMDRKTVRRYRAWAREQGLIEFPSPGRRALDPSRPRAYIAFAVSR
jgi:transposase